MDEENLEKVIKEKINPMLGAHGGFSRLAGFEINNGNYEVYLEFYGSCQSCSAYTYSTKSQIENIIKQSFGIKNVNVFNLEFE